MIIGNKEVIGKRVWAYVPKLGGGFDQRCGSIKKFLKNQTLYLVAYDGEDELVAAQPSWLILEPNS